jgi:hypothetical protein
MIARYCAWHLPARLLLEEIDDGKPERIETDTICPACTERVYGVELARKAYRELAAMTLSGKARLVT